MMVKVDIENGSVFHRPFLLIIVMGILYMYIYNPPFTFLPLSCSKLLYPILLFCFLFSPQIRKTYYRLFQKETLCLIGIVITTIAIDFFIADRHTIYPSAYIGMFFECFLFAYTLAFLLNKYFANKTYIILLMVTTLASLITMFLISNPEINSLIRLVVLKTDEVIESFEFRSFGISEGTTFAYAIVQGIAASMALKKVDNIFVLFILFSLYVISIAFNARIGFVPIFCILLYMLCIGKDIKKFITLFILIACTLLIVLSADFSEDYIDTIEWVSSFFIEIFDLLLGKTASDSGNMQHLTDTMLVFPETISGWLWGTGEFIFGSSRGKSSDIGYILLLYYGGVLFVFQLFYLIYLLAKKISKYLKFNYWFFFLFIGTVLISNWKGTFVITNPGFRFLMLLYFLLFIQSLNVNKGTIKNK